MRSLAPQLVALVLAVPVSTVASTHATSSSQLIGSRTAVATQPARSHCSAFCQARILRHRVVRVHGRTVAIAHRAALPVPPPPRLGWHRKALRVQLTRQVTTAAGDGTTAAIAAEKYLAAMRGPGDEPEIVATGGYAV